MIHREVMPAFLHFYPGFDRDAYYRLPRRDWMAMIEYMQKAHS